MSVSVYVMMSGSWSAGCSFFFLLPLELEEFEVFAFLWLFFMCLLVYVVVLFIRVCGINVFQMRGWLIPTAFVLSLRD